MLPHILDVFDRNFALLLVFLENLRKI